MKIKSFFIMFVLIVLGITTIQSVIAAKYNCGWISPDGTINATQYSTTDTVGSNCRYYKGSEYTQCAKRFNEVYNAYKSGKCDLISEKHYAIDGCDCTIEYSAKTKQVYAYGCSGGSGCNSSAAQQKLKSKPIN